ncbi:ABC transporter ATP-binding protein [Dactylosporangium sp. AC04546]|uniref:ABC transporter ATP-binding protein n=1 Tax=Dactylosporangium sp. AC04546 TaxID=2862460 RepID=UPI001EDE4A16|nr:ABC transporter ATP-binding protein [Dactylosporangium sp. AC04546]WVK88953.1 ABC transporter ATP-binding protein [Dactylosporangium sp. AC04546]
MTPAAPEPADGPVLLPIAGPRRTRAALRAMVLRHPLLAAGSAVTLLLAAALSLVTAPLLGRVVDLAAGGAGPGAITGPVLLLAASAVGQGGLAFAGLQLISRLGEVVLAAIRDEFVDHALRLPLERIEQGGAGDLTSRITEDVAMISVAVRGSFPEFVQSVLVIALTLVGLTALDWRFGAAALLAVPVQAGTARWYVRRSAPLYAQRRVAAGAEQQQLLDTIGGAQTVRAFGLRDEHLGHVADRVDRSIDLLYRVIRLQTRFFGRLNVAEAVGLSAVLATGFLLVNTGAASIGAASAAALYFANLFGPINTVLFLLDTLQSAHASLARLVGVTDLPAEQRPQPGAVPADGAVKASGLRYAYRPGHPVLHDVDLDIPAGSTVALVGASGGGKTTLAKLLAGVHEPSGGSVHLGGVPLADLDAGALRRSVVLVSQESHVFAGTVADDLRLAAAGATDDDIDRALAAVGAQEWVAALPDGPRTVVGDGGHELTVVQAQQLALARVLLADPLVAILDEATADAGSSGARVLEAATARVLHGRTGVVVAHRLTQAAAADLVVVVDAGRIVESGPHADLVAAGGGYARLWAAWSAGREEPA